MLLEEVSFPNSINILNRLKEKLKEQKIKFKVSNNKLKANVDVLEMVLTLLEEPRT